MDTVKDKKDEDLIYLTFVNLRMGTFVHYGEHSAKKGLHTMPKELSNRRIIYRI